MRCCSFCTVTQLPHPMTKKRKKTRKSIDAQFFFLLLKMAVFIEQRDLALLHEYKYSGEDRSLISKYILQPWWTFVVQFVPLWVAPNVLTLTGLFATFASYLAVYYFTPSFQWSATETAPGWVYALAGFLGFAYQTLDAIDGKQARRTGMAGPLGELFDHGCDSINVSVSMLVTLAGFNAGLSTPWIAAVFLFINLAFFGSCWEMFHTHTLFLPVINGPVEGHLIAIAALLATAALGGPVIWDQPVSLLGATVPARLLPLGFVAVGAVFTLAGSLAAVLRAVRGGHHHREGYPRYTPLAAVAQIAAPGCLTVAAYLWAQRSRVGILQAHPHIFLLAMGFAFAHITDRGN